MRISIELAMSEIQETIKRLRAHPFSLSQSQIARQTGIPQPRISRWEGGDVATGADDALKLVALERSMTRKAKKAPKANQQIQKV